MLPRRAGFWVFAVLAIMPAAPAAGAVPREGNAFSPSTAAELLEAADTITAESAAGKRDGYQIHLLPKTYAIDRPLVIRGAWGVALQYDLESDPPVITNAGAPGPLLELAVSGAPDAFHNPTPTRRGVIFRLTGSSSAAFPAVHLERGGTFQLGVEVPASTPNVTAVQLGAFDRQASIDDPPTAAGFVVTSLASSAPAVRIGSGGVLNDSVVLGGNPAVDLVDSPGTGEQTTLVWRNALYATPATETVLRAAPGTRTAYSVSSNVVDGTAGASTLVSVAAPTAPAAPQVLLRGLTLDGTSSSTALRIAGGAVDVPGLLSLGSATVIGCVAVPSASAQVTLEGFYAEGSVASSPNCAVTASGRRTGELRLVDRNGGDYEPLWGSTLIDGGPTRREGRFNEYAGSYWDLYGGLRYQVGKLGDLLPEDHNDIGAIEYQPAEPETGPVTGTWVAGEPVHLSATAVDPNGPGETAELRYEWRTSDGAVVANGADATWQPPAGATSLSLILHVVDPSGRFAWRSLDLAPTQASVLPPDLKETSPRSPTSTPTPTPTPRPPSTPPSTTTKRPPTLLDLDLVRKFVSRNARRPSGPGATKKTEGKLALELTRDAQVTITAAALAKGVATTVPGASFTFAAKRGIRTVRLTTRFGSARLKRGLYRLTVAAPGPSGQTEQQTVVVRIR